MTDSPVTDSSATEDPSFDSTAVLADTPRAHDHVFLDSAGSSLMPTPVLETMHNHLRREGEVGGYRAAEERAADIEAGYEVVATLLGCLPTELAFTDSATRAWQLAFDAVPLRPGSRILITEVEYASNALAFIRRAAELEVSIEVVPSEADGSVSLTALREMLDERVALVSLVHVPTNGGLINPVREVVDAAHEVGAIVLLDACQSAGQLDFGFHDTGADLMSCTGRKWLRGPRGTGVLAVRESVLERLRPRMVDLRGGVWVSEHEASTRDDARVFELWEFGVADRLGLIAAAAYANRLGLATIEAEVRRRAAQLREGLAELPGVSVRDIGAKKCGIVTFTVDGWDPVDLRAHLRERDITVSVSWEGSTLLDMRRRGLGSVVRASPHYFVPTQHIEACVAAVAAAVQSVRSRYSR